MQGGAGGLHHLHLGKHNIRCREVQAVQAHLRHHAFDVIWESGIVMRMM